jgi:hypothetical protein
MIIKVLNNFTLGKNHLGKAVFATRDYKPDQVIVKFEGKIIDKDKIPKNMHGSSDRYVQISKDKFMGPSKNTDDFINHSCEPNCGLLFRDYGIILVAIKNIKIGDEITWDYSTSIHNDSWKMKCKCLSKKCRGDIGEFKNLSKVVQTRYIRLGIVPDYIAGDLKANNSGKLKTLDFRKHSMV